MGEMRLHLYNNFPVFGFCFCRQSLCETKVNPHYAGFMIFSYPNATNYNLNMTEYLFINNDTKIYNIDFSLKENIRIDNNIFGLIYSGIKTKGISNYNYINFFSSINSNTPIGQNSILHENEKIKVSFDS